MHMGEASIFGDFRTAVGAGSSVVSTLFRRAPRCAFGHDDTNVVVLNKETSVLLWCSNGVPQLVDGFSCISLHAFAMCNCLTRFANRLDELAGQYCWFPEVIVTITTIGFICGLGGAFVHVLRTIPGAYSNSLWSVLVPFSYLWLCTLHSFLSTWLRHAGPIGEQVCFSATTHSVPSPSVHLLYTLCCCSLFQALRRARNLYRTP